MCVCFEDKVRTLTPFVSGSFLSLLQCGLDVCVLDWEIKVLLETRTDVLRDAAPEPPAVSVRKPLLVGPADLRPVGCHI